MKRSISIPAVLVATVALSSPALSGEREIDTLRRDLTGGQARTWILRDIVSFKGVRSGCKDGEVYRFLANGTMEIRACRNGRMEVTPHRWTLVQDGPLDVVLVFGARRLQVSFRGAGEDKTMRLRDLAETARMKTTDMLLRMDRKGR